MDKPYAEIATDIIYVAELLKSTHSNVAVSAIVPRADKFKEKTAEANKYLVLNCQEKDFALISHDNIIPKIHLKKSKLGCNNYGNGVFVRNLKDFLHKYQWLKSFKATKIVYSSSSLHKDNVTFSNDVTEIPKRKIENFKNTVIGHSNINSLRNKFVFAQDLIRDFDIILISESKLDDIFPNNQLKIDYYKMFRFDRNRYRGSLVLYVNKHRPCKKLTNYKNPIASEIIVLEFHQSKRKDIRYL